MNGNSIHSGPRSLLPRLVFNKVKHSATGQLQRPPKPEPLESFQPTTQNLEARNPTPGKKRWGLNPDSRIRLALEGAGTIFSGLASYAGFTKPVTKQFQEQGLPDREQTCPKVVAVLEQPLGEGMTICPKEEAAYKALNGTMKGLYPTLERALSEPDDYKAELQGRFEAQKKLTPDDPYAFDFSDYAVPVFTQVSKAIDKEVKELKDDIKGYEGRFFKKKAIEERQVGLQYLGDLKAEIDDRVERKDFSYRRTQELGYFSSCALGHFDMNEIHPRDKALLPIDSYLQAEDKVGIEEEYRRYRDNEFSVYQKSARSISGFKQVEKPFEEAFFNPDKMEVVNLPTLEPLGEDPFMRLQNKDIYLSGIAADPISADGFMRQGRLFWIHDVRHNSAIFSKKKRYEEERNLSSDQIKKLDRRIDVWNSELKHEIDQIEDRHLLNAVETVVFSIHHDRGHPLVPSVYEKNQLTPATKALRLMWGISGQDQRFDNPRKNFKQAYSWVEDFFSERREQEREIVGR